MDARGTKYATVDMDYWNDIVRVLGDEKVSFLRQNCCSNPGIEILCLYQELQPGAVYAFCVHACFVPSCGWAAFPREARDYFSSTEAPWIRLVPPSSMVAINMPAYMVWFVG